LEQIVPLEQYYSIWNKKSSIGIKIKIVQLDLILPQERKNVPSEQIILLKQIKKMFRRNF